MDNRRNFLRVAAASVFGAWAALRNPEIAEAASTLPLSDSNLTWRPATRLTPTQWRRLVALRAKLSGEFTEEEMTEFQALERVLVDALDDEVTGVRAWYQNQVVGTFGAGLLRRSKNAAILVVYGIEQSYSYDESDRLVTTVDRITGIVARTSDGTTF